MNLLQRLLSLGREQPEKRFSFNEYLQQLNTLTFGGISYPSLQQTLVGGELEEVQEATTPFFREAYKTNGPVFACTLLRLAVFSQGRFTWQRMRNGRPDEMFGNRDLGLLETPWAGGTLQQLLARMEVDVVTAGNSYWGLVGGTLTHLQPEWLNVLLMPKLRGGQPVGFEKVGYVYYHEGKRTDGTLFTLDEVVHYMPHPDPDAHYRGMSWLRPVIDDTQGDKAMERHKLAFLRNGATPNMIVRLDPDFIETVEEFREFHDEFKKTYEGADNAYKTLFLAGAADAKVVGADFSQMTFTSVQGRTETRIAMAAGTHPVLVGMSEGMQGSSLNEGNFNSARRAFVDRTLRFLWEAAAGSFQQIFDVPAGARLWYDARDVAFLREDRRDLAQIQSLQAQLMATLVRDGWNPDAVIRAVEAEDWTVLLGQHSGNLSVQLQPADPDQQNNSNGNDNGNGDGEAERLIRRLLAYDKALPAEAGG